MAGRNEQNIMVVFPKEDFKTGDFVEVLVQENTATTLKGLGLNRMRYSDIQNINKDLKLLEQIRI